MNEKKMNISRTSNETMMNNYNEIGNFTGDPPTAVLTGDFVLNSQLEVQRASGEFVNNKYLVENITNIIYILRVHQARKLTRDHFLGMTIQFSDHYYKIDLSNEDQCFVERYRMAQESDVLP